MNFASKREAQMNDSSRLVPHHSHWGAFLAEVKGGRFVGVRPFPRDPDPSPLIEAMPAAVYSPSRVAEPMVREGFLARGRGAGRGREAFVPVPWERALDLVASELDRVRRAHGHDAIMGGSQGWGSAGIFHDARGQVRRFLSAFGGFTDQTSNYSFGAALTFLPHVLGSAQAVSGPLTSWSSIARHTRLLLLFGGANPKNMQVAKGGCGEHAASGWMAELARDQVERALPADRDERLAAAALAMAGTLREPALPHHRPGDAGRRMDRGRDGVDQRRGIGIMLERPHADDPAVLHLGQEGAPMGMIADEGGGHGLRAGSRIRAVDAGDYRVAARRGQSDVTAPVPPSS